MKKVKGEYRKNRGKREYRLEQRCRRLKKVKGEGRKK